MTHHVLYIVHTTACNTNSPNVNTYYYFIYKFKIKLQYTLKNRCFDVFYSDILNISNVRTFILSSILYDTCIMYIFIHIYMGYYTIHIYGQYTNTFI